MKKKMKNRLGILAFQTVIDQTEARFGIIQYSVQLGSVWFSSFRKNRTKYLQDKIKEKRILREVSLLSNNGVRMDH